MRIGQKGFTMVEVLTATSIMGIVVLLASELWLRPHSLLTKRQRDITVESELVSGMETLVSLLRSAVSVRMGEAEITGEQTFYIMTNQAFARRMPPTDTATVAERDARAYPVTFTSRDGLDRVFQNSFHNGAGDQPGETGNVSFDTDWADFDTFRVWEVRFFPPDFNEGDGIGCHENGRSTGCFTICMVDRLPNTIGNSSTVEQPTEACTAHMNPSTSQGVLGTFMHIEELAFEFVYADCPRGSRDGDDTNNDGNCLSHSGNNTVADLNTNGLPFHGSFQPPFPSIDAFAGCFAFEESSRNGYVRTGALIDDCNSDNNTNKDFDIRMRGSRFAIPDPEVPNIARSEILVRIRIIGERQSPLGRVPPVPRGSDVVTEYGANYGDPEITDPSQLDQHQGPRPFLQTAVYLRNWSNLNSILAADVAPQE